MHESFNLLINELINNNGTLLRFLPLYNCKSH